MNMKKIVHEVTKINSIIQSGTAGFTALGQGITEFTRVLLLYVGGILIIGSSDTTGTVVGVLFLASVAMQGTINAYQSYGVLMFLIGSLERMFYLYEYQARINKPGVGKVKSNLNGEIEFDRVSFAYPTRREAQILNTISFVAEPGEKVGIIGENGSGKSTIAALLQQWYRPVYGYITIDKIKSIELDPFWLRRKTAVITHDSAALFNGSIAANIAYGDQTSIDEVKEVCKKVGLHEFINEQEGKYSTYIGEGGLELSSAQRQKIAVARVLLRDTKIVILDEPTQGLDSLAEKKILMVLRKYIEGKTAIVLSVNAHVIKELGVKKVYELKDRGKLTLITKAQVKEKVLHQSMFQERQIEKNMSAKF